jgi:hypothetical protein
LAQHSKKIGYRSIKFMAWQPGVQLHRISFRRHPLCTSQNIMKMKIPFAWPKHPATSVSCPPFSGSFSGQQLKSSTCLSQQSFVVRELKKLCHPISECSGAATASSCRSQWRMHPCEECPSDAQVSTYSEIKRRVKVSATYSSVRPRYPRTHYAWNT